MADGVNPDASRLGELERAWSQHADRVRNREPYQPTSPLLEAPESIASLLSRFADRPDVKAALQPLEWTVGYADLTQGVLSYQRIVITEDSQKRVASLDVSDSTSLYELCLPPAETTQLQVAVDQTQGSFTASSPNPNLRLGGFGAFQTAVGPAGQPQQVFGYQLSLGTSFVQLTEYQDRWMVRDGYHRIYGLLQKGISKVPCVIVKAQRFEETGAGRPGFFDYELMFGERPPRVTDFVSSEFSFGVKVQAVMKVVRIRAEEFFVPIYRPGEQGGPPI